MLPELKRTWTIDKNTIISGATSLAANQNVWYALKERLVALGMVVKGSQASTIGAMDGVDRWTSASALAHSASAGDVNHAWLVLEHEPSGIQWCMDFANAGTINNEKAAHLIISLEAGFAASGTRARPTATDEIVLSSGSSSTGQMFHNVNEGFTAVLHSWTDGEGSIRVGVCVGGKMRWLLAFQDFEPGENWLVLQAWRSTHDEVLTFANYRDITTRVRAVINEQQTGVFLACLGHGSTVAGEPTGMNDITGETFLLPMHVVAQTANARGVHGTLDDWWYGSTLFSGDYYPGDAPLRQLVQFGNFVFPGDGGLFTVT